MHAGRYVPVMSVTVRIGDTRKRTSRSVRSYIMEMFYDIPHDLRYDEWVAHQLCPFANCVNPRHMFPRMVRAGCEPSYD